MKSILFLLVLQYSFAYYSFCQNDCNYSKHLGSVIKINIDTFRDAPYLSSRFIAPDTPNCLGNIVKNDIIFFDYIKTNYISNKNNDDILALSDPIAMKDAYIQKLVNDTLFHNTMNEYMAKAINHSIPKDTVTIDYLLNIAAKFFSIQKITEDGYYAGKVCVGINDIKNTEPIRRPFVESFCFSAIVRHYKEDIEFKITDEFHNAIRELYTINFGIDRDERLLRAQGAMYLMMRRSAVLKEMLHAEYLRLHNQLPFILK